MQTVPRRFQTVKHGLGGQGLAHFGPGRPLWCVCVCVFWGGGAVCAVGCCGGLAPSRGWGLRRSEHLGTHGAALAPLVLSSSPATLAKLQAAAHAHTRAHTCTHARTHAFARTDTRRHTQTHLQLPLHLMPERRRQVPRPRTAVGSERRQRRLVPFILTLPRRIELYLDGGLLHKVMWCATSAGLGCADG